jgi:ABC-type nitrate/sulfonate/bicarbonate transport system substrate-binding protein
MDSGTRSPRSSRGSLGRNDSRGVGHKSPRSLAASFALLAFLSVAPPAQAQEQLKIGIGFGLAFLPIYICEDLKLVDKHAKELHLTVKASFQRFLGAGPLHDAIASGAIAMGPFGTAPLLAARERAKNTPRQIFAVSGITTMPLVLLSDRPNVRSLADFKPADRIAIPTLTSPQLYLLEMQSEKIFGRYDRLLSQVVALSHADAIAALRGGAGPVTAYFSSAPFTQIALRDEKIHRVLSSEGVINGKASFLIMGATRAYIETHPKIPEAIDKAMDEAARIIHDDPRRAAQIYLAHEPSRTLDAASIEAVLKEIRDEFGSAVHGLQAFADFMGRHGELKTPPQSWKEIVAPALLNSPST